MVWYRKLYFFYKIYNKQAPGYLTKQIATRIEAKDNLVK